MRSYTISPVCKDIDWNAIPILPIDFPLWGTETDIRAQARVCYDKEALHIKMEAAETHIRAEEEGPLASPCRDSCLEFFFSPMDGDSRYFNIEFSPTGCMYLGFGGNQFGLFRLIREANPLEPAITRTCDGWEITYRVPFAMIHQFFPEFEAKPGKCIRANFYKCGDRTVNKHYLCWNPITGPVKSYHLPEFFAPLYFG